MAGENVIAEGVVKLSASAGPLGAGISSALASIKGPLGEVKMAGESAATSLGGSFQKAGGMIAAGFAIAGVAAIGFAVHSADTFKTAGLEVLKMQRFLGDTAQEASKWRFAAQQSGVDTATFTKSVGLLSKGLETGKISLDKFGISSFDSSGKLLPMNDILLKVADKMKSLPPGMDRTALAMQLFGKAGAAMVPFLSKGADGIRALQEQAQKYGQVLTGSNMAAIQANLNATRQQTAAWQGLQIQIGQNVLPMMTKLTTEFTGGLLKVMPAVSGIMNATVIPAFSALTTILGGTIGFLASHTKAVEIAAAVIGAALVPAVVAWGVAQAVVLAQNTATFIIGIAGAAVRGAASLGLMTGSLEAGTAAMTTMGLAAGAVAVGIGLIILQNRQMQDSANKAASAVTASFKDPQQAIVEQTALQAKYHAEMQGGITVLGAHIFATEGEAKAAAMASKNYAATTAELNKLKDAQKQAADTTTQAGDAITAALTKSDLKIKDLGGASSLTGDQIQSLADYMGVDLTKGAGAATAKLAAHVEQLGYTSEGAYKLSEDTSVLSTWMSTAAEKTKAFSDALNSLMGVAISADEAEIKNKQAIEGLAAALAKGSNSLDENTKAGQTNMLAIDQAAKAALTAADAIYKQTGSMDKARAPIDEFVAGLTRTLTAAHVSSEEIARVIAQLDLTPAAIASVTPAVNDMTGSLNNQAGAWGNVANAVASAIGMYNQAVASSNNAAAAAVAATGALNNVVGPVAGRPTTAGPPTSSSSSGQHYGYKHYDVGGMVDGPKGAPQLAIVHGGERVLTTAEVDQAKVFTGPGHPTGTYQGGGDTYIYITVPVAGSVVSDGQLVAKIRTAIDTYNQRGGRR